VESANLDILSMVAFLVATLGRLDEAIASLRTALTEKFDQRAAYNMITTSTSPFLHFDSGKNEPGMTLQRWDGKDW
jgi:hypothetical protein